MDAPLIDLHKGMEVDLDDLRVRARRQTSLAEKEAKRRGRERGTRSRLL